MHQEIKQKDRYYFLINSLEGGGAERVTLRISEQLAKDGNQVDIITLKRSKFYDIPAGVNWIALSGTESNIVMFLFLPLYIYKCKRIFRGTKYTHGMSLLEIANFIHILSRDEAIISLRNSIDFFCGISGKLYKLLIKLLYPLAAKIVTNSKENEKDIIKFLELDATSVVTVYNPINVHSPSPLRRYKEPINYDKDKTIYITIGRLVWQKQHEKIIKGLKLLYDSGNRNFLYYIIGDGTERKNLEGLVKAYGMSECIFFMGEQKNIMEYLSFADYFLYASIAEGFPNVLLEAMSMGLPIITTDFKTGAREIIFGTYIEDIALPSFGPNGLLLRKNNFEEDFFAYSQKINTLKQQKKGIEQYMISTIVNQLKREILIHK